jgi:hypothetical protein
MITKLYDFAPLTRETVNGKRHYCTPDGKKLPSVTTILDKTKPQEKVNALHNWRKRVGEDAATTIVTEAANTGTIMHGMLEEYLLGTARPPGTNFVQKIAYPMAQTIITNGLIHLTECWGTEIPLYYPELYAGTTDGAGLWKNKPAIIDFKQTNKPKKREWIEDYFIQLTFYGEAMNKLYDANIKTGVILMCSRNCEYQEFVIENDEWEFYANKMWDRVEQYYHLQ